MTKKVNKSNEGNTARLNERIKMTDSVLVISLLITKCMLDN